MAFGIDDFAVAVGLTGLAKEVLWPLLKGSLEDHTKNFFKGCIADVAGLAEQEPVQAKNRAKAKYESYAIIPSYFILFYTEIAMILWHGFIQSNLTTSIIHHGKSSTFSFVKKRQYRMEKVEK